eukprot:2743470-Prymnesium_polylepis.1
MYRTSIQLNSYAHLVTEPYIGIQRYSTIQRTSDTTRYSDTDVSPPLRAIRKRHIWSSPSCALVPAGFHSSVPFMDGKILARKRRA